MRSQEVPIKMATILNTDNTYATKGVGHQKLLLTAGRNAKPLWKMGWQHLNKLNILLSHDPTISLIAIYLEEFKINFY